MKQRYKNNLEPISAVPVLDGDRWVTVAPTEVTPERVGWKAYGMSCLPTQWVPAFVVVEGSVFDGPTKIGELQRLLETGLAARNVPLDHPVLVRSSGAHETLEHAGQLESKSTPISSVAETIRDLQGALPAGKLERVHWVVQRMVASKQKGHLSNERHVKREHRDWVVEFDLVPGGGGRATVPIAVRPWRDGAIIDTDLSCSLTHNIHRRLKQVAMWATRSTVRRHFEWVWDGKRIHIVQMQTEVEPPGQRPHALMPKHLPPPPAAELKAFRVADAEDRVRYRKLRNASVYEKLGYHMPEFYVLDEPETIGSLLRGEVPPDVSADLERLTARPLVIRTDGTNIPKEKREMLPRSEGLYDQATAVQWITTQFLEQLRENDLLDRSLCLVAHSFIPSVASAWARAEPNHRYVRVESLWGIPEGLYWYSHDTYIVDMAESRWHETAGAETADVKSFEHLRYKANFIAPDADGRWIAFHPSRPHQWGRSIQKDIWLYEIAETTSKIAEHEGKATVVMWFVGTHPEAVPHQVLPWYHSGSDIGRASAAAPRNKLRGGRDVVVRTAADWDALRGNPNARRIERVIVSPADPELIRNPKFARDLGTLAVQNDFVVELSGGVLSHAYYMLKRSGARVECSDLFEGDVDTVEYNKVVRDRIPELIQQQGEEVVARRVRGDALVAALRQKLVEEAFEVLDMPLGADLLSELVDVEEVVEAIYSVLEISRKEANEARTSKVKKRGAFQQGVLLEKTVSNLPSDVQPSLGMDRFDPKGWGVDAPAVVDVADLPAGRVYRRPDLRMVEIGAEKLLTVEFDINAELDVREELSFQVPTDDGPQDLTLAIEFKRARAKMRGTLRVRTEPKQLSLNFEESGNTY